MEKTTQNAFHLIVLAAGQGTRMRSAKAKVLHEIAGRSMIVHAMAAAQALQPESITVVIAPGQEAVQEEVLKHAAEAQFALQQKPLGTGHALAQALAFLPAQGTALILYGDTPLLRTQTLAMLLAKKDKKQAALAMLAMQLEDPAGYGRLVLRGEEITRIVECKDANPEEKLITAVWGGVLAADCAFLHEALLRIPVSDVTGEYYLTLLPEMAVAAGKKTLMADMPVVEASGVNDRAQLAYAESVIQSRLRTQAMQAGVTLVAPETVFLAYDTQFAMDVVLHPHVVIGRGVTVETGAVIKSFSHLEQCVVRAKAVVGPYARLRPGADIGEGAHIGNFVEVKNSHFAAGAKANHLSYIGDAEVGTGANIGAGTITCNYDGKNKFKTEIGSGAFIGSNTALVAPVSIGEGAVVAAGSVITQDVPPESLAIARGQQVLKQKKQKKL